MKSIKFGSVVFNLVDTVNVDTTRLQATIYPGNYTMEQIVASTKDCNNIQIVDEGKILGQYAGYTVPVAYALNYMNSEDTPIVSIELANLDILSQINTLTNQVSEQATTVSALSSSVSDIDSAVQAIADALGGDE